MGVAKTGVKTISLIAAVSVAYLLGGREDTWYRMTTSLTAVKAIATMPTTKLERFLLSYAMFEKDQFVGEAGEMELLTDYYSVLNHLCAIGNFEKMYLPPMYNEHADVYSNQMIYERKMAKYLEIGEGSRVADIGCGRGRVAHHVASYTGAHVTGVQIDEEQVRQARKYATATGMDDKLDFKLGNYNDRLPFEDNSLDAAYYVQVLSYSTNLTAFFSEIFRIVKPGARVAFEDYVRGTEYKDDDPHHYELKKQYEPVLGGVETSYPWVFKAAVEAAGFEVVYHEDDSVGKRQFPLLEKEKNFWLPLTNIVGVLHKVGIVPQIYFDVMERMTRGTDALIEADMLGVVSCGVVTFAQKPVSP